MKRKLAWIGAILSGLYLLIIGPLPFPAMDPLPFIDEVVALGLFLKCTSYLGYDLRKWLPFMEKKANPVQPHARRVRKMSRSTFENLAPAHPPPKCLKKSTSTPSPPEKDFHGS